MAEVVNRTLRLNASELREMTGWPEAMIEEFLSLLDNLNSVIISNNSTVTVVEETSEIASAADGQIGWIISRMRDLGKDIAAVEELVAQANSWALKAIKRESGVKMSQIAARINAGQ